MIKVNVDGKNYVLDFAYSTGMDNSRITTALLIDESKRASKNYDPEYFAVARKHPKDRDVKENGRKAAIRKLVSRFDYKTRSSVWAAYFAR
jgi:hypothetical protein